MVDSARPHRTRMIQNVLAAANIQRMNRPAYALGTWDMLLEAILKNPSGSDSGGLEELTNIPQEQIEHCICTMPRPLGFNR